MRFPLAVAVVFIHMNPSVKNLYDSPDLSGAIDFFFNIGGILLSHVLSHIAVPCFFLISGFLFFRNLNTWDWAIWTKKMKSRIKTLLIPYFIWNLLTFSSYVMVELINGLKNEYSFTQGIKYFSHNFLHAMYDYNTWGNDKVNFFGMSQKATAPFDIPLWFLRDLIVVTIFSPVIYYVVKRSNGFVLLLLAIAYITKIWFYIPGISIVSFFFFSLGAFLTLFDINFLSIYKKGIHLYIMVTAILLCLCTYFNGNNTQIGQCIYPFFVFFGVFTCFYVFSQFVVRYNFKVNKILVSSCFFIYAFHAAPFVIIGSPISICESIMHRLIPGVSVYEDFLCYTMTPLIVITFCVYLFRFIYAHFPLISTLLSGNRQNS